MSSDIEKLKATDRFQELYVEARKTSVDDTEAETKALRLVQEEEVKSPSAKRPKANDASPTSGQTADEIRKKRLDALEAQQRKAAAEQLAVNKLGFKKRAWELESATRERPADLPQVADPEAVPETTALSPKETVPAVASTPQEDAVTREPSKSSETTGRKTTLMFFDENEAEGDCRLESAYESAPSSIEQIAMASRLGHADEGREGEEEDHIDPNALDNLASGLREGRTDPNEAAAALQQAAKRLRAMTTELAECRKVADHYGRTLGMVQMVLNSAGVSKDSQEQRDTSMSSMAPMREQEQPKNYMFKRGDPDLSPTSQAEKAREQREAAAAARQAAQANQQPQTLCVDSISRDAMEQQRKERIARLEKQQESAKKEREESDRKAKAREAMFDRNFGGAGKPLGSSGGKPLGNK